MARLASIGGFGDRIAGLRVERGWTQQELADRLAMSRTALSHLEAGMRVASERTVVILAGIFGIEPLTLVSGTSYPMAKAERLPVVAALYTEVDLVLAIVAAELALLEQAGRPELLVERGRYWTDRLTSVGHRWPDRVDRRRIDATLATLRSAADRSDR